MKSLLLIWQSDRLRYFRVPIDRIGDFAMTFTVPVVVQELTGTPNATWDKMLEVLNIKHIGPTNTSFNLDDYCIGEDAIHHYKYNAILAAGFKI